MADERLRTFMFSLQAQAARRRKLLLQQAFLINVISRRRSVILVCCLITILLTSTEASALRSCRWLHRNLGWWDTVWRTYSDARFKKTFRISRATFQYILNKISGDLHQQIVAEDPISPECRLGICLEEEIIIIPSRKWLALDYPLSQQSCWKFVRQSWNIFGLSVSPIIFQRMRLSLKRKCWILRNCGNSHAVGVV